MVHNSFDIYRDELDINGNNKNTDVNEITRPKSNNIDDSDSDVTKAIKDSIERNTGSSIRDSETSFKQVYDLAMNVVNELPAMVNITSRTVNKMIVKGKEGIESINNFKNAISCANKSR